MRLALIAILAIGIISLFAVAWLSITHPQPAQHVWYGLQDDLLYYDRDARTNLCFAVYFDKSIANVPCTPDVLREVSKITH